MTMLEYNYCSYILLYEMAFFLVILYSIDLGKVRNTPQKPAIHWDDFVS